MTIIVSYSSNKLKSKLSSRGLILSIANKEKTGEILCAANELPTIFP